MQGVSLIAHLPSGPDDPDVVRRDDGDAVHLALDHVLRIGHDRPLRPVPMFDERKAEVALIFVADRPDVVRGIRSTAYKALVPDVSVAHTTPLPKKNTA